MPSGQTYIHVNRSVAKVHLVLLGSKSIASQSNSCGVIFGRPAAASSRPVAVKHSYGWAAHQLAMVQTA